MSHEVVGTTGVRVMLGVFADLGLDSRRIQDAAGISEGELHDPDRLLPARAVYRMWEVASDLWARPALGLEAGTRVPLGAYEVLDYLLASGDTLSDGIRSFASYFSIATRTARYEVDDRGGHVRLQMVWQIQPQGIMFHLRDYSLSAAARRIREVGAGAPVRVELEGPPFTTEGHYARVFGAPTVLRADANALVFTRQQWTLPLGRADQSLQRTLRRYADLLLARSAGSAAESLSERVRRELLQKVRVGLPPLDDVARALGVGSRTLQRQLRQEGSSFAALSNQVRAGLAVEYLRDPALSIGEVAYLLGFSEPSAFTRAFRRWTGHSPGRHRRGGRERP